MRINPAAILKDAPVYFLDGLGHPHHGKVDEVVGTHAIVTDGNLDWVVPVVALGRGTTIDAVA